MQLTLIIILLVSTNNQLLRIRTRFNKDWKQNDEVVHLKDIVNNAVVIFNAVAYEKHNNIRNYLAMGRHSDVDTFYLCQTYSSVLKHLVRDYANFLVLFKQDETNLKHVYDDHVNTDMTYPAFKEMCVQVWNTGKNSFLVVDKERDIGDGRYRMGLDEFIKL